MKRQASEQGSLRVIWRTPIGPMSGEITSSGLRALNFPGGHELSLNGADDQAVEILDVGLSGEGKLLANYQSSVEYVTTCLRNYFNGQSINHLPEFDLRGISAFDRQVWEATARIPAGETITYGQLAAAIDKPGAARAVGGALGRNRFVLLVPCHRVVASATGARRLGGFGGGLKLKEYLLNMESERVGNTLISV